MALHAPGAVRCVPGEPRVTAESAPSLIGHITLGVKRTGEPCAGNPHARFDRAGTGNGSRRRLNGHAAGNGGHSQVSAYEVPRRPPTLPRASSAATHCWTAPSLKGSCRPAARTRDVARPSRAACPSGCGGQTEQGADQERYREGCVALRSLATCPIAIQRAARTDSRHRSGRRRVERLHL